MGNIIQMIMNIFFGGNQKKEVKELDKQIVELGITYEYCIESINVCGVSDWACDLGFTNIKPGDVNDDGDINVLDVVMTVNIILLLEIPTEYISWAADLNYDGFINIMDVVLLVNQILN